MKAQIIKQLLVLTFLMTSWIAAYSQYQAEVPGDNFSLEGALELFKKSSSPQEFERMLNDPESRVNNLDLNRDGYIDYIRVIDYQDGNVHAFVIQAVISEVEFQDIAVITLEKKYNGKAILQITGDPDIYGIETIIEPTTEVRTYGGSVSSTVYVNVWSWPVVRYIYGPHYTVWISPWGWSYRPTWWYAWRPIGYYDYYTYWRPYYRYYSPCYTVRIEHAHYIYHSHRTTSVIVHKHYNERVVQYRSNHIDRDGNYRSSNERYSRGQQNTSVRYNSNGRIATDSRTYSRTSSNGVRQQNSDQERQRSYNSYESRPSTNRSESVEQRPSSNRTSSSSNDRSSGNSNVKRSNENSRTYKPSGNSNERSTGSSNMRQSSGNTPNYRSTERSSGNSNSSYRSSGNSNVQRSNGNSNVQRSSSNRSSGSSVQHSSGSSNSRSSNVQKSSGKSSGSSNSRSERTSSSSSRSSNSRR